jgi:hypothetical protein
MIDRRIAIGKWLKIDNTCRLVRSKTPRAYVNTCELSLYFVSKGTYYAIIPVVVAKPSQHVERLPRSSGASRESSALFSEGQVSDLLRLRWGALISAGGVPWQCRIGAGFIPDLSSG